MSDSIWKKELHLRRAPAEPKPEKPESIWKKEITFRRSPKDAAIEELPPAVQAVLTPPEPAVELVADDELTPSPSPSLRVSADPWLAEPELPVEIEAPALVGGPAKVSFWKKERSPRESKRLSLPKRAPKEPKPPKQRREWKRPSLPRREPQMRGHEVKRYVGLKIGASQLAAARVANNGAAELLQLAREPLAPGVVVGGELRDPEALAQALKKFFARNKLPRKNVRLGIASNRIGVRMFEVDGIADEKQLDNAIRFRAQEVLSIPLDEAVLDYHVVHESIGEDGTHMRRVLLVVAYRELVERYVSACRKAGLTLAGVDLEAFALLRSLASPRAADDAPPDAAIVAVAIGHDRSTFAVSDGHVCEFTRVIEWGGASLSVAIARALDLAPSEVEHLKRSLSLESTEVPEGVSPHQYSLAVEAVRRALQGFARELVASLQFYQAQSGSLGISEIVVTGGTAGLHGLAAELERLVGARVRVGDPLARVRVAKKVSVDEHVGSLAVAIGLGIED